MIVIGADTHKRNHTLVALDGQTGALKGQVEIAATDAGSMDALRFAAGIDEDRVWAIEDCRHVSARLEGALLAAGERVIRVPAGMTGQTRKVSRQAGKSDPIDARAVALAVVRDGVESFPVAFTDQQAMEIRVLADYRDQIIRERVRMINRLRWHLVAIAPG
jgi:transposase